MEAAWKMRVFPLVSASLLVLLTAGSALWIMYARPSYVAHLISRDVSVIAKMLKQIDRNCAIIAIQEQRVPVDFLTIKSFEGSEVGNIGLAYPAHWQGPYAKDNPTLQQGILYDIVKLKEGYFVVPGFGAILPNNLTIGKDFELHSGISFKTLTMSGGPLNYHGIIMGAPLDFHIGDWKTEKGKLPDDTVEKLDRMVNEFNEAMTYTQLAPWLFEYDSIVLFDTLPYSAMI